MWKMGIKERRRNEIRIFLSDLDIAFNLRHIETFFLPRNMIATSKYWGEGGKNASFHLRRGRWEEKISRHWSFLRSIWIFAKIEHMPSLPRHLRWDRTSIGNNTHTTYSARLSSTILVVALRANIWRRKLKLTIHINLWSPPPSLRSSVSLSLSN